MKFQKSATTLVAIVALAAANTAFATVICAPGNDLGAGLVSMAITISPNLAADATFNSTGSDVVSVDVTDCTTGKTNCTVSAQGTPGGGPQLVTFAFDDGDGPASECSITKLDGLPVELSKFSVE